MIWKFHSLHFFSHEWRYVILSIYWSSVERIYYVRVCVIIILIISLLFWSCFQVVEAPEKCWMVKSGDGDSSQQLSSAPLCLSCYYMPVLCSWSWHAGIPSPALLCSHIQLHPKNNMVLKHMHLWENSSSWEGGTIIFNKTIDVLSCMCETKSFIYLLV